MWSLDNLIPYVLVALWTVCRGFKIQCDHHAMSIGQMYRRQFSYLSGDEYVNFSFIIVILHMYVLFMWKLSDILVDGVYIFFVVLSHRQLIKYSSIEILFYYTLVCSSTKKCWRVETKNSLFFSELHLSPSRANPLSTRQPSLVGA